MKIHARVLLLPLALSIFLAPIAKADVDCHYDYTKKYIGEDIHLTGSGRSESAARDDLERNCNESLGSGHRLDCKSFRWGASCE